MRDIVLDFSEHIRIKYAPIQVKEHSIRELMQVRYGHLSEKHRETLEAPITVEELRTAVFKGDSKKPPSKDGICL